MRFATGAEVPKAARLLFPIVAFLVLVSIFVYTHVTGVSAERFSEELDAVVDEVKLSGDPIRLASVTDFEWDEVAAFEKRTPVNEINELMGDTGLGEGTFFWTEDMFIFRNHGKVVRCLKVSSYIHSEPMKKMGLDATIIPDPGRVNSELGYAGLLLTE